MALFSESARDGLQKRFFEGEILGKTVRTYPGVFPKLLVVKITKELTEEPTIEQGTIHHHFWIREEEYDGGIMPL